jgi:hypothetical protein
MRMVQMHQCGDVPGQRCRMETTDQRRPPAWLYEPSLLAHSVLAFASNVVGST